MPAAPAQTCQQHFVHVHLPPVDLGTHSPRHSLGLAQATCCRSAGRHSIDICCVWGVCHAGFSVDVHWLSHASSHHRWLHHQIGNRHGPTHKHSGVHLVFHAHVSLELNICMSCALTAIGPKSQDNIRIVKSSSRDWHLKHLEPLSPLSLWHIDVLLKHEPLSPAFGQTDAHHNKKQQLVLPTPAKQKIKPTATISKSWSCQCQPQQEAKVAPTNARRKKKQLIPPTPTKQKVQPQQEVLQHMVPPTPATRQIRATSQSNIVQRRILVAETFA